MGRLGDDEQVDVVAHREATGDPHALTDLELAELGDPNSYQMHTLAGFPSGNLAPSRARRPPNQRPGTKRAVPPDGHGTPTRRPDEHDHAASSTSADLPLDLIDASLVAVAERLGLTTIATLDHRDFRVVRPTHCDAFELVP